MLLLSKTESIEIQKLEITEQMKMLEESIKLKEHKLVSNESHITKLETDQTAQQEEILKLQHELNECNTQLQEKNNAIENSTSTFETLRLQFNESAALNVALKKQLEEALSENERLLNLSNEFEKEKDFEIAMKPELKDAETQSELLRFNQFEHYEAKEFIIPGNERMPLLSSCVTLDQPCQTESPELSAGAVKFVYIQPDQKQTFQNQADEIVDVKAFDLSAVAKDNNSLCYSTNDPDFDNNVNNENIEFLERLEALDDLVSKYEIENVCFFDLECFEGDVRAVSIRNSTDST